MNLINLNIFINDTFYKKLTVPEDSNGGYDSRTIMMGIFDEKKSGKLEDFNVETGMSVRIEIENSV